MYDRCKQLAQLFILLADFRHASFAPNMLKKGRKLFFPFKNPSRETPVSNPIKKHLAGKIKSLLD